MIIQLKSKETGKDIPDGEIEVEDNIMLQAFCMANEVNLPFSEWFNKMLKNYIKNHEKEIITDKFKNDLSDYDM
jgi:hypothetical protein